MINLIVANSTQPNQLIVIQTRQEDGLTIQMPIRFAGDLSEVEQWVSERGGDMGALVNDPICGECQLAHIGFITLDDAFTRQATWGDPVTFNAPVAGYVTLDCQ